MGNSAKVLQKRQLTVPPGKLPLTFYQHDDVVALSRALLGKVLCTKIDGIRAAARITETEAYAGVTDRASHAYGDRRTRRTEPMYSDGGIAYVYLCYGIHHLFNVVTSVAGTPHAVLIRGGVPLSGEQEMRRRRGKSKTDKTLLGGPGSLARALGITTSNTGESLIGNTIWIEDDGYPVSAMNIEAGPRVGIDYAKEDALLPYRFVLMTK